MVGWVFGSLPVRINGWNRISPPTARRNNESGSRPVPSPRRGATWGGALLARRGATRTPPTRPRVSPVPATSPSPRPRGVPTLRSAPWRAGTSSSVGSPLRVSRGGTAPSRGSPRRTPRSWTNTSRVPVSEIWLHLYLNAFKNQRSVFLREPVGRFRGQEPKSLPQEATHRRRARTGGRKTP